MNDQRPFGWRQRFMILALALAAYAPTLHTGFLWDDHVMIESNPALRQWSTANLRHDLTTDVFDGHGDPYFRPVQTWMNRVDYSIWGLRPFGFHLTNLLFHMGNSLLVAELALALGFLPIPALMTACFFAVHPIVVEELMIIAGRGELIGLCFCLASLLLLMREGWESCLLGCLAYAVGLGAKESVMITPVLCALIFAYRRTPARTYWKILPLLVLTVPYLWLRQRAVGPLLHRPDYFLMARFYIQDFPSVLYRYFELLVFPWNLHSHRLVPHISHFWLLYLGSLLALIGLAVYRKQRLALFCLAWFLINLLPKTPVMIFGNFMLDHWAYPASVGFFLGLAAVVVGAWKSPRLIIRLTAGIISMLLLIGWALGVHLNVALRGTDEKMYRWALNFTSSNPIKHNLGVVLLTTGRSGEAIPYFEEVRADYPDDPVNTNALALAYWKINRPTTAMSVLTQFLHRHPDDAMTLRALARMRDFAAHPQQPRPPEWAIEPSRR